MKSPATFAAFSMALALSGCNGDLTRDQAAKTLNNDPAARVAACEMNLTFVEGGFDRAVADSKIKLYETLIPGAQVFVADIPGGQDRWVAAFAVQGFPRALVIRPEKYLNRCLPGRAEVTAIVDGPIASLKIVEFTEIVSLPPELMHMSNYVHTRYKKKTGFQRTDQGWRIAQ